MEILRERRASRSGVRLSAADVAGVAAAVAAAVAALAAAVAAVAAAAAGRNRWARQPGRAFGGRRGTAAGVCWLGECWVSAQL